MESTKSAWSLKAKLVLLVSGVTLVLGVVFGLSLRAIYTNQKEVATQSFSSSAQEFEKKLTAQFFERYGDVQAFALNPEIRSNDTAVIENVLNNYAALYGIYDLILIVDNQGRLRGVNTLDSAGAAISNVKALYQENYADAAFVQGGQSWTVYRGCF
jgi:hypothetical protein